MITNFKQANGNRTVLWEYNGKHISKNYEYVIYSLNVNNEYVVIVEPDNKFSPDNAVIYNSDGNERVRVTNPFKNKGAICFGDVYYVKNEIALVSITRRANYICIIDIDGNVQRTHETR